MGKLSLAVIFTLGFVIATCHAAGCPADADDMYMRYGNRCFKLVKASKTFDEAAEFCRQDNGFLATLDSRELNTQITDMHFSNRKWSSSVRYWIGGRQMGGIWEWQDGSQWSYTNWFRGQPGSGSDRCVAFKACWAGWAAQSCHTRANFICEVL